MHWVAIARIGSDSESTGTLNNVYVRHLAIVQNTQVYGLGVTDQKFKHHRMRNRLKPPELDCRLRQSEKLRTQVIVCFGISLLDVPQLLQ